MPRARSIMLISCSMLGILAACKSSRPVTTNSGNLKITTQPTVQVVGKPTGRANTANPTVFRTVQLSHGHSHGVPASPEWILLERRMEPANHKLLHKWSPHGSTVSGGPNVFIGASKSEKLLITIADTSEVFSVSVDATAPLGIEDYRGNMVWWTAVAIPATLQLKGRPDSILAFQGMRELTALEITNYERSVEGVFSDKCGFIKNLKGQTQYSDPDGFLRCYSDELFVIAVSDRSVRAEKKRMDSYQTIVFYKEARIQFQGRFIRLLREDGKIVIVVDKDGLVEHTISAL